MKYLTLLSMCTFFLTLISCGEKSTVDPRIDVHTEWLIPRSEVFDGGPGKDGIPSVDNPNFSPISEINFLNDDDLVVGFVSGNIAKAYPHKILDWHEIVNDDIGSDNVAITYCPLTGTAVGWDRLVNGKLTTFGVSGKLYNTNLMPYDRTTDSYWSQLGLNCVNGALISTNINTLPVIETSWGTWKKLYPATQVMNTSTGFSRNYNDYPYGDYRTNHANILFPINPMDTRLQAKERVLGVISGTGGTAYRFDDFLEPSVIIDAIDGQEIIVVGSRSMNFLVAFKNNLNLQNLEVKLEQLPVVMHDDQGNQIAIDGKILDGPLTGNQLKATNSFIGYWFSFGAFYPDIEIH